MKLQFNNTGAWRQVLTFMPDRCEAVQISAVTLLIRSGSDRCKMRILNDDATVYAYCEDAFAGLWSIQ
jgi:hypothetical protein